MITSKVTWKLQEFLLELGKGFSFVARQKRITIEGDHYYVDLVFYNYILKCFVVIDLKAGKLTYQDIGQIDFYVRYFEDKVKLKGDNPTIGIILCTDKNDKCQNTRYCRITKIYLPQNICYTFLPRKN